MSDIKKLILIAARARASGLSWRQTADMVKRHHRTVYGWRDRHKAEWERCYALAQAETSDETGMEAVATLRNQLRNKDDKVAYLAAKALLVWFGRPAAQPPPRSMTDDDRARLLKDSVTTEEMREFEELAS